jgi:hypothetical protein
MLPKTAANARQREHQVNSAQTIKSQPRRLIWPTTVKYPEASPVPAGRQGGNNQRAQNRAGEAASARNTQHAHEQSVAQPAWLWGRHTSSSPQRGRPPEKPWSFVTWPSNRRPAVRDSHWEKKFRSYRLYVSLQAPRIVHARNLHLIDMASVPRQFDNLSLTISANVGCPISFRS